MDYKKFFNFKEAPFHITPDPAFYFPSRDHQVALETLLYTIRAGEGVVQITGDPGMGKTLIIRTILRKIGDNTSIALIFNPRLSPHELLLTLLEDLGFNSSVTEGLSREAMLRSFLDFLLQRANEGGRVIVIIDEAQNLPLDTLEELRLLTNLETEKEKLLQIILVGQRELESRLELPEFRQLHQRITIRYCLHGLTRSDIHDYISHRLKVATCEDSSVSLKFTSGAVKAIYSHSKGVPRIINILCERSLMAAFVDGSSKIDKKHFTSARKSVQGNAVHGKKMGFTLSRLTAAGILTAIFLGIFVPLWTFKPDIISSSLARLHEVYSRIQINDVQPLDSENSMGVNEVKMQMPLSSDTHLSASDKETEPPEGFPTIHPILHTQFPASDKETKAEHLEASGTPEISKAHKEESALRPPDSAFHISSNAHYVHIPSNTNQARVWKGGGDKAILLDTIAHEWNHGRGIFLAGDDPRHGPYIFDHSRFLQGSSTSFSSPFFNKIAYLVEGNAVPVIVGPTNSGIIDEAVVQLNEMEKVFRRFVFYWENLRIDDLFEFYASAVTNHSLERKTPIIWSWEDLYQRKQEVFQKSGYVDIDVSREAFFVDPTDHANVMVVYHQNYRSQIWEDQGTKLLYFGLQNTEHGRSWKAVAEFWVTD